MQKKVTLISIVVMALVLVITASVVVAITSSSYRASAERLEGDIRAAQADLDSLIANKDINGFTPTDVVKAFFVEVQTGTDEKAKLYLAPDVQDMDFKATLKLGSDLESITTGDNLEENSGEDRQVSMTFVLSETEKVVRTFTLSKYDSAWKIMGVIAE